MPDYISNNLTTIIVALVALFVGVTIGIVVKVKINKSRRDDNSNRVNQSGNTVLGDQAGRDLHKR
jgi:uncharacterized protein YneF (UPF0154 family)